MINLQKLKKLNLAKAKIDSKWRGGVIGLSIKATGSICRNIYIYQELSGWAYSQVDAHKHTVDKIFFKSEATERHSHQSQGLSVNCMALNHRSSPDLRINQISVN